MYAIFNVIFLILTLFWPPISFGSSANETQLTREDCDHEGWCVAFLEPSTKGHSNDVGLCDFSDFSILWKENSGNYLVQCRSGDTAEDNVVWIVDRKSDLFKKLNFGRFFRKSELEGNPNPTIPDIFSSRPVCHTINLKNMNDSDFILLDKLPSDSDTNPYCYDPVYVYLRNKNLVMKNSKGKIESTDADHSVQSVPTSERVQLDAILDLVDRQKP